MSLRSKASNHLEDEFPLIFDAGQVAGSRLVEIGRAIRLLERDSENDPETIAEMKRQLRVLAARG
jgi:hypothetical protein